MSGTVSRVRIEVRGIVQGVGFRPFVYRLAGRLGLTGWVVNAGGAVIVEAQGPGGALDDLVSRLREEVPPLAVIHGIAMTELATVAGEASFVIGESAAGAGDVAVSPDCDVCPACLAELFDDSSRRYRHPFVTCTECGPRYSIITGVPYDRPLTTMAGFPLCPECRREYEEPTDRRFHAQPVACPACGPRVRLLSPEGMEAAGDAIETAAAFLRQGRVVAVKSIGGYHLAVNARDVDAVALLRVRKQRDEKPFALMAQDLDAIRCHAAVSPAEERLLQGPERPIVLLKKAGTGAIAGNVSPGNDYLGFMLPSSPLHHLLLDSLSGPLVMTSGNRTDEPMAYRDDDALTRLCGIADCFLVHDRPIHVRVDDSVLRVFDGQPLFLRRSRGYVPRQVALPSAVPEVLALGADLKNCLCLASGSRAVMSHHIGDVTNPETLDALREAAAHLSAILGIAPRIVAHDLHPDYLSSRLAEEIPGVDMVAVQHHHAHMASCMAENLLVGDVIGIIFDGTGYGPDGTIWGGEFLAGGYHGFERAGQLAPVRLPGGDVAAREPVRMALAWLYRHYGAQVWDLPLECLAEIPFRNRQLYLAMLDKGINSPETTSCGRLFDAVAAILNVRRRVSYEAQAAIELEALAEDGVVTELLPYAVGEAAGRVVLDPAPALARLAERYLAGESRADLARTFHATLAAAAADAAETIRQKTGLGRVVLSGGVFQNRLVTADLVAALRRRDFAVFVQRLVSPNDSGLALGQSMVAGSALFTPSPHRPRTPPCAT